MSITTTYSDAVFKIVLIKHADDLGKLIVDEIYLYVSDSLVHKISMCDLVALRELVNEVCITNNIKE